MTEPKLLYDHVKTDEEHNKLFDERLKEETDWWENEYIHTAMNPTEENLASMREVLEKSQKNLRFLRNLDVGYF